ncbi:Anoctamin-2 [Chionoecetes opilio]|uniref:Anoctamin n=1 Tax=Chionoecetes opilio TaxID=41210 RepID=A0A8J5CPR4_CHIOP|nr:Anoctamin-2 [Chionoecetes opilio]
MQVSRECRVPQAEAVLQYGFVTIFVSSFPLAPIFALLNNIFEMRLDAYKLLSHFRRPIPQRVKDIGVWFKILDSIGKLAVITNAFIIAFTSNFIPELVYRYVVSDGKSLDGFLDYSLSTFQVAEYPPQYRSPDSEAPDYCRYPDYRQPPDGPDRYRYTPIYWHILAARLAFVVVFELGCWSPSLFKASISPSRGGGYHGCPSHSLSSAWPGKGSLRCSWLLSTVPLDDLQEELALILVLHQAEVEGLEQRHPSLRRVVGDV